MRIMHHNHKLATCCYCGSRTVLTLGGSAVRHELACAACGAPLHAMKQIKAEPPAARPPAAPRRRDPVPPETVRPRRPSSRPKMRKPTMRRLFDVIEDAAEEVFDIFD
jgi:hypothetical protein